MDWTNAVCIAPGIYSQSTTGHTHGGRHPLQMRVLYNYTVRLVRVQPSYFLLYSVYGLASTFGTDSADDKQVFGITFPEL